MAEVAERKRRLTGNFYAQEHKIHAPFFLRRNVRQALDYQERRLLLEKRHEPTSGPLQLSGERRVDWKPPLVMMGDVLKGIAPVIHINKVVLRHADSANLSPPRRRSPIGRPGSPEWLPLDEWKVPCQISVRILHRKEGLSKVTVSHETKSGHILRHDHPNKDPAFEITIDTPFEIAFSKFEVMVEYKDSKGYTKWKLARDEDRCQIDFRVLCSKFEDTADLLSQLEGRDVSEYANLASDEGGLGFWWNGLPHLPASGTLIGLKRRQRKKVEDMRYKAEVKMAWTSEVKPLVAINETWQQHPQNPRQLPTPSVSCESELPRRNMRIQYFNREGFHAKNKNGAGLRCFASSCAESGEHSSLERLMLHYALYHNHMKVEIDAGRSTDELTFILVSQNENAATYNQGRKEQFVWQAPDSAFDIKAHLKGTNPWTVRKLGRNAESAQNTPQKNNKKRLYGERAAQSPRPAIAPGGLNTTTTKPEDILDLPQVPRKRHKVPRVEGISFYRTLSKQQVSAGAEVSDSELDVDMDWSVQIQRRGQTLLGLDDAAQDFNEVFNKHLDEEQPMSHLRIRDAIVRFARKFAARLSEHRWKGIFKEKLEQFRSRNIISPSTVAYCMGLLVVPAEVETVREVTPASRSSQALSGKGRFVHRGASETRTPERTRAMSPPSQSSTQNRMRWRDGKMSQEERDAAACKAAHRGVLRSPTPAGRQRQFIPLGRRNIICRRSRQISGPHLMSDLVRDHDRSKLAIPDEDIQPADLDFLKLVRILDGDLVYTRDADIIVCTSSGTARPIVDENDWRSVLGDIQKEGIMGDIVIELQPHDRLLSLLEASAGASDGARKRKRVDETDSSRKKVRIQENLCVCGTKAEGVRGTIACGHPKCSREFHMRCVKLQQRPATDWLCADCSAKGR